MYNRLRLRGIPYVGFALLTLLGIQASELDDEKNESITVHGLNIEDIQPFQAQEHNPYEEVECILGYPEVLAVVPAQWVSLEENKRKKVADILHFKEKMQKEHLLQNTREDNSLFLRKLKKLSENEKECLSNMEEEDTDRELESSDNEPQAPKDERIQRVYTEFSKVYNASRKNSYASRKVIPTKHHSKSNSLYDCTNNYLTSVQWGYLPNFPMLLAHDAKLIVEHCANYRSRESTVIFCVALRNKDRFIKKFAFWNLENKMSEKMFNKATQLGYDVVVAEATHAEGQFLQFLHKRKTQGQQYTHIMGMGCSRMNCSKCAQYLGILVHPNYLKINGAIKHAKDDKPEWDLANITPSLATDGGYTLTIEKTQTQSVEILTGEQTKDDQEYDGYRMPKSLEMLIKAFSGLSVKGKKRTRER